MTTLNASSIDALLGSAATSGSVPGLVAIAVDDRRGPAEVRLPVRPVRPDGGIVAREDLREPVHALEAIREAPVVEADD